MEGFPNFIQLGSQIWSWGPMNNTYLIFWIFLVLVLQSIREINPKVYARFQGFILVYLSNENARYGSLGTLSTFSQTLSPFSSFVMPLQISISVQLAMYWTMTRWYASMIMSPICWSRASHGLVKTTSSLSYDEFHMLLRPCQWFKRAPEQDGTCSRYGKHFIAVWGGAAILLVQSVTEWWWQLPMFE